MANLQLPQSVRDARGQAMEALMDRQAQIDLSPILIYRIDSVPDSALPFLAWQFDVADALFQLLSPGADRRALIKNAIALKRKVGTPYAIKTALANLGWDNAVLLEGQNSWGGTFWPSNQGWAVCRILINLQALDSDDFSAWQSPPSYPSGSLVSYNGNFFWASGPAAPGTIPQFSDIADVPEIAMLSDVANLVQAPWHLVSPGGFLTPTSDQIAQIIAAFYFFAPERCWLDSVQFVLPPMSDSAPVPADALVITGIAEVGLDQAPPPVEGTLAITITLAGFVELYPPIAPLQNNHYPQKGHNQGANEPIVDDGPIVINGVIHGESS